MNALYNILTLVETIPLGIFMVSMSFGKGKNWGIILSFFSVLALLLFNIVQLILEISLEKSMFFSIFLIITWTLWLGLSWNDFWDKFKKALTSM